MLAKFYQRHFLNLNNITMIIVGQSVLRLLNVCNLLANIEKKTIIRENKGGLIPLYTIL